MFPSSNLQPEEVFRTFFVYLYLSSFIFSEEMSIKNNYVCV